MPNAESSVGLELTTQRIKIWTEKKKKKKKKRSELRSRFRCLANWATQEPLGNFSLYITIVFVASILFLFGRAGLPGPKCNDAWKLLWSTGYATDQNDYY